MYFIAFLLFIELYFAATLAPSVISLHNICCDTVAAYRTENKQLYRQRVTFKKHRDYHWYCLLAGVTFKKNRHCCENCE